MAGSEAGVAVDIVIPIYGGFLETRQCIESVLACAALNPSFELVLIDDRSPDTAIRQYLAGLPRGQGITVLENERNLGFVGSVNRGMALHRDRDLVLLNSDTEVAGNWLERLRRAAHGAPDVGTVTPFSNNATICSFPVFCADNPMPEGIGLGALDQVFARTHAGRTIEIPTAVGFCMYIRRDCLERVGPFDAERFGRGYGEESDFCRRAAKAGWRNLLCADTFVFHRGGASFGAEREGLLKQSAQALRELHPEYDDLVRAFVRRDPAAPLRQAVEIELTRVQWQAQGLSSLSAGMKNPKPVLLHVVHDLGGGIERWYRDFCGADGACVNLILKPHSAGDDHGQGLALFAGPDAPLPERLWQFREPIAASVPAHQEYRAAIDDILIQWRIDRIIVSSLLGHALDILETGVPTVLVCHDYYPFCPAINTCFGGVCDHCDDERIAECAQGNPDFNPPFLNFPSFIRRQVRDRFLRFVGSGQGVLVAPSRFVRDHLARLDDRFRRAPFVTIPHGYTVQLERIAPSSPPGRRRLRVMVLGMLAPSKGIRLLMESLDQIVGFADLYLVGAKEAGALFKGKPGVQVVDQYEVDELQGIVERIQPDVGLLLSIWPETFSYTLSELFMLGVPPVATRLGAFAERIRDGETGFLIDPTAVALVARLRAIDGDRRLLVAVRENLRDLPRRDAGAMVADYHRLLGIAHADQPGASGTGVICLTEPSGGTADPVVLSQAMALVRLRKRVRSLELQRDFAEVRQREAEVACLAEAERGRTLAGQLEEQTRLVHDLRNQIAAVLASTSWRVTWPIRALKRGLSRLGGVGRSSAAENPPPAAVPPAPDWRQVAFQQFRQGLSAQKSAMVERLRAWPSPPLISILVPVFNTRPDMLRQMLDSVLDQYYPHWELCLADDGSTEPGVRRVLDEYVAKDPRVRVDFGVGNRGVSHASNRALALARGEFVVLLDHDDMLEPQALYRVAEAVLADDPDLLYSDEVLVAEDGRTVQWYVFRPAFSPEYLRSHPYIVHLVGFRRNLLLSLGGFDEDLRISQDYDLILRASEKAGRIVHIPELLYRWRLHGDSAGHQRKHQVMATSRAVLGRHLARCGEAGTVEAGAAFNFFETRYPLREGLRVAIVIPTRNHGDMTRRCIESIQRTTAGVACDIVLVDHASDDPPSLAYFGTLPEAGIRVLRHEGPFNFSAINNRAVRQLEGYSHYLFCNNDIEATAAGWLHRMLELGQKPDIGIVGAKLYYPDGRTLQHAGVCLGMSGIAENLGRFWQLPPDRLEAGYLGSLIVNREVSAVTAACLLVSRQAFDAAGGMDERLAVGYGDVDFCLRVAEKGYRIVFCHGAELLHHESQTRGPSTGASHPGDTAEFLSRWRPAIEAGDPYYNPNLALDSTTWAIRMPMTVGLEVRRRLFDKAGRRH